MTPEQDDATTELVAESERLGMYPLTLQQITDRLAEEAGWRRSTSFNGWVRDGEFRPHPFPPDSIDAAVRAVPEGYCWLVSGNRASVWVYGKASECGTTFTRTDLATPASNLYAAIAMAKGWTI